MSYPSKKTVLGVFALFALVALEAGMQIAAFFILCGICSYLNVMVLAPCIVSSLKRRAVSNWDLLLSACAVVGTAALIALGFAAPLAICTLSLAVIAVIARMFGRPGA